MRWQAGDGSNIEDNRGRSGGRIAGIGLGGMVLLLALSWATGIDFTSIVGSDPTQSIGTSGDGGGPPAASSPQEEQMVKMVDAITGDIQSTWQKLLGSRYQPTRVVLFRDAIQSACGGAQAATGPFYCPSDEKVYLDLGFFSELDQRFGAPGDFAQAYVVAHEIGHHVQHLMGTDARVGRSRSGANSTSVALELQADCYAGVWGHEASQGGRFQAGHVELEPGDAEEALRAAASIGDDRLQKMSTGHIAPDQFTHGSSAQRQEWFQRGMRSGDPRQCDTFASMTQ